MGFWDTALTVGTGGLVKVGSAIYDATSASAKVDPYQQDPNAYKYGGQGAGYYADGAAQADARKAPQLDWSQYNQDRQAGLQDRAQMQGLAGSYQGVIDGTAGPSLAEMQLRQGQQQQAAQAAQLAGSARGGIGAQMAAQRSASNAAAIGAVDVNSQAAQLRAQETNAARSGLGQTLGMQSTADLARGGAAQSQQGLVSQNSLGQQNVNASREGNYLSGGLQAARDQGSMSMAGDQARQGGYQWAASTNVDQDNLNKQREAGFVAGLLNGGSGAITSGAGGGRGLRPRPRRGQARGAVLRASHLRTLAALPPVQVRARTGLPGWPAGCNDLGRHPDVDGSPPPLPLPGCFSFVLRPSLAPQLAALVVLEHSAPGPIDRAGRDAPAPPFAGPAARREPCGAPSAAPVELLCARARRGARSRNSEARGPAGALPGREPAARGLAGYAMGTYHDGTMATKKAAPRNEADHDAKRTAKRWNLTATDETRALAKRLAEGLGVSESKLVAMALVALDSRKRKPDDAS